MAGLGEGTVYACWFAAHSTAFAGLYATSSTAAKQQQTFRSIFAGGFATAIGSSIFNVTDVCKIRMQAETMITQQTPVKYASFYSAAQRIFAEEGLQGLLLPGITATALRDVFYSGLRVGLYPIVKDIISTGDEDVGLANKLLIGACGGALGSLVANPMDLVKIRMMADAGIVEKGIVMTGLKAGERQHYSNSFHCAIKIVEEEGLMALYRGSTPTVVRAALGTSAQLATYDHTKYLAKEWDIASEGPLLHVTAGVLSGFAFATASAPADIMKSRVMADRGQYASVSECFRATLEKEGLFVFYRGWTPSAARLGLLGIVVNPLNEQMRLMLGLGYF